MLDLFLFFDLGLVRVLMSRGTKFTLTKNVVVVVHDIDFVLNNIDQFYKKKKYCALFKLCDRSANMRGKRPAPL